MERWLYLKDEPREKIEKLSYELSEKLGNYWDFSRFVEDKIARERLNEYSLNKLFKNKDELEKTVKLVIGQEFHLFQRLDKNISLNKSIRLAFRIEDIWADFIAPLTNSNYTKTNEIFKNVFEYSIENYPFQHKDSFN